MKAWSNPMIDEINLSATEHSEGPYTSFDGEYTQDSEGYWYKLSVQS